MLSGTSLTACRVEFFGRLRIWREFNMTSRGNLLLKGSAMLKRHIGIFMIGWVFHSLGKRREGKAAPTKQIDQIRQHLRVEGSDMEQKYIGDVTSVERVGHFTEDGDVLVSGRKVACTESLNCLIVLFNHAARIWRVPEVISKVHRDLRDLIVALLEIGSD